MRSLSLEACMAVTQESSWVCRLGANNLDTSLPLSSLSCCTLFRTSRPPVCVSLSVSLPLSPCLCLSACLPLTFSLSSSISVSLVVSASFHLFPLSPSLCLPLLLTSPPASTLISLLLHTVPDGSRGCRQIICPVGSLPGTVWAVADKVWGGWGRCPVAFQSQSGRGTDLPPRALASYCSCSLCFPGEKCAGSGSLWSVFLCTPASQQVSSNEINIVQLDQRYSITNHPTYKTHLSTYKTCPRGSLTHRYDRMNN